jgi:2-polyprenyl-3-methyl-5-hydroxy-6-metoxy-1,4-benzoquinol methylase
MNNATTSTPCPLCGHANINPFLSRFGYDLKHCGACGHLHVNPMPDDAALVAHYQQLSYFEGEEAQGYRNYEDMHRALKPHFERRLTRIESLHGGPGSLLDFGCADGYFLQLARDRGWKVSGVELSAEMAARASARLSIPIPQSLDALEAQRFDAVTLWEVIEHVPRPIQTLHELRQWLRPGGTLMFSTPNNGHWQAVRSPDAWHVFRPPSHLQYFTDRSARTALESAAYTQIEPVRTMPLPALPGWLESLSAPLYQQLGSGQARRWTAALWLWRAIRAAGLLMSRLTRPTEDVYMTLEVAARTPAK